MWVKRGRFHRRWIPSVEPAPFTIVLRSLAGVVDAVGAQAGVGVQEHGGLDLVGVAPLARLAQAPALDLSCSATWSSRT